MGFHPLQDIAEDGYAIPDRRAFVQHDAPGPHRHAASVISGRDATPALASDSSPWVAQMAGT